MLPVRRWSVSWSCSPEAAGETVLPAPYWGESEVRRDDKPSCKPTRCSPTKGSADLFSSLEPSETSLVLLRWLQ